MGFDISNGLLSAVLRLLTSKFHLCAVDSYLRGSLLSFLLSWMVANAQRDRHLGVHWMDNTFLDERTRRYKNGAGSLMNYI